MASNLIKSFKSKIFIIQNFFNCFFYGSQNMYDTEKYCRTLFGILFH